MPVAVDKASGGKKKVDKWHLLRWQMRFCRLE